MQEGLCWIKNFKVLLLDQVINFIMNFDQYLRIGCEAQFGLA